LVLQEYVSDEEMRAWAWRIPFAVGAVLAFAMLLFAKHMNETAVSEKPREAGSLKELARYPGSMVRVIILSAAGNLCFFTFTTYMQKFLVNTSGLATPLVNTVMACAIGIFLLLQPPIGALSDKIGRRTCLLIFCGIMTVAAYPLLSALSTVKSGIPAFALVMSALVLISFYTSVSGLFKSELFPVHVRAMGVGIGHNVASALFGGSAEFVALYAKQQGREEWFYMYVAATCAIGFVTAWTIPRVRSAASHSAPAANITSATQTT
jgi:MHS family alpha-ketoglutarate permease-like MFS transporter